MSQKDNTISQAEWSFFHSGRKSVGRTPQLGSPRGNSNPRAMKKATRLGLYLYISAHIKLKDQQIAYIANFQAKLNLEEVQRALQFSHVLTTDPRTRARNGLPVHPESEFDKIKLGSLVPFLRARPARRDQRRIGVGYRDKGSLPRHSRPKWDKQNDIFLGESEALETGHWDLTILYDPDESSQNETRRSSAGQRINHLSDEHLPGPRARLEQTGERDWKITLE